MLLCGVNLLQYLHLGKYNLRFSFFFYIFYYYLDTMAQKIENAIATVIKQQRIKTRDIGGYATQQDFLRSILHQLGY
jgi:isocitrate/isopropylmalate dehydrogenase